MKTCNPLPGDLVELLLYFDSLQSICAIDDIRIIKPGAEDVPRFVEAIDRVAALAEEELSLETRITHV
ncbi:MAG: hypothetical protein LBQ35_02820, partial [Spirochaetaceae bacterium]|jgi:hypothetical protein|nr:hypothetical protein [Spirochaetaceae bacterium]